MEGGTQPRRFLHLRDFPPQLPSVGGQKRNSQDEQGQKTVTDQNIGLGWVFWLLCSNLREEKNTCRNKHSLAFKELSVFFLQSFPSILTQEIYKKNPGQMFCLSNALMHADKSKEKDLFVNYCTQYLLMRKCDVISQSKLTSIKYASWSRRILLSHVDFLLGIFCISDQNTQR